MIVLISRHENCAKMLIKPFSFPSRALFIQIAGYQPDFLPWRVDADFMGGAVR
jgi:hypothetical protein